MPTLRSSELRALFRQFAGQDRYRDFVRTMNRESRRKGRFRYWQEQLWNQFAATIPDAPMGFSRVIEVFGVCDVHDCPLQVPSNDRPLSEIRDTPELDQARDSLFPFASDRDLACPHCDVECEKWIAENCDLCNILRHKTTYEEHCIRWLEQLADPPDISAKIKLRSAEIAAEMEPGDELWEWDAGGWHHLSGSSGVAIVRNGKIVKRWCDGRS